MSMAGVVDDHHQKKYNGVRRRRWGKWVSEIRVPGSQERLWLGSYRTPEAAAVAHDIAFYCLRRPASLDRLNFPMMVPVGSLSVDMSPRSVQKVASDAGMGVDAKMITNKSPKVEESGQAQDGLEAEVSDDNDDESSGGGNSSWSWEGNELSISVEDYLINQGFGF